MSEGVGISEVSARSVSLFFFVGRTFLMVEVKKINCEVVYTKIIQQEKTNIATYTTYYFAPTKKRKKNNTNSEDLPDGSKKQTIKLIQHQPPPFFYLSTPLCCSICGPFRSIHTLLDISNKNTTPLFKTKQKQKKNQEKNQKPKTGPWKTEKNKQKQSTTTSPFFLSR